MAMQQAPYLVIGGSKGIGRALCERLISSGHPVIVASRTAEGVPAGAVHLQADVVADGLPADHLPPALAGMAYCPGSIDLRPYRSIRPEELRAALELNVVGAFRAAQACGERLKQVPGAGMVFFSTVAVGQGMPFHASVAAAKGAVEGMARALAAELAPTVRVNVIAPSLSDTPLASKLLSSPEKVKAMAERHPLKRVGTADDIAAMAAFLLGPDARWITGQVVGVDGGMSRLR
jgi:NAD(P)-dependent dehydrogenase (short-subunit alcohol dehydrogenase family)